MATIGWAFLSCSKQHSFRSPKCWRSFWYLYFFCILHLSVLPVRELVMLQMLSMLACQPMQSGWSRGLHGAFMRHTPLQTPGQIGRCKQLSWGCHSCKVVAGLAGASCSSNAIKAQHVLCGVRIRMTFATSSGCAWQLPGQQCVVASQCNCHIMVFAHAACCPGCLAIMPGATVALC